MATSTASPTSSPVTPIYGDPLFIISPHTRKLRSCTLAFQVDDRGKERFYDLRRGWDHEADLSSHLALTCICSKRDWIDRCGPYSLWRTQGWWGRQCFFRGLSTRGGIRELKQRLRDHQGPDLSPELKVIRDELRATYLEANQQKVDELWASGNPANQAAAWPKRLLYETFEAKPGEKSLLVITQQPDVSGCEWLRHLTQAARENDLVYETLTLPMMQLPPNVDNKAIVHQVVVGKSKQAVSHKDTELREQHENLLEEQGEAFKQFTAKRIARYHHKWNEATRQDAKRIGPWNVTGQWAVCMPQLEEKFSHQKEHKTLEDTLCRLHLHVDSEEGKSRMTARFDFIVLFGVMRFLNPELPREFYDRKHQPEESLSEEANDSEGFEGFEGFGDIGDSVSSDDSQMIAEYHNLGYCGCGCHTPSDTESDIVATWSDYGSEEGVCECEDDDHPDSEELSEPDAESEPEGPSEAADLEGGQPAEDELGADIDNEPPPQEDSIPPEFQIPNHLLPSDKNKHFTYRWMGGFPNGILDPCSDQNLCSLWFVSPHTFKGVFTCDETIDMPFYGYKISKDEPHGQKREREEDGEEEDGSARRPEGPNGAGLAA